MVELEGNPSFILTAEAWENFCDTANHFNPQQYCLHSIIHEVWLRAEKLRMRINVYKLQSSTDWRMQRNLNMIKKSKIALRLRRFGRTDFSRKYILSICITS